MFPDYLLSSPPGSGHRLTHFISLVITIINKERMHTYRNKCVRSFFSKDRLT